MLCTKTGISKMANIYHKVFISPVHSDFRFALNTNFAFYHFEVDNLKVPVIYLKAV